MFHLGSLCGVNLGFQLRCQLMFHLVLFQSVVRVSLGCDLGCHLESL